MKALSQAFSLSHTKKTFLLETTHIYLSCNDHSGTNYTNQTVMFHHLLVLMKRPKIKNSKGENTLE